LPRIYNMPPSMELASAAGSHTLLLIIA